jgi:hypothetical protein
MRGGANLYSYSRANPVGFADPSGLVPYCTRRSGPSNLGPWITIGVGAAATLSLPGLSPGGMQGLAAATAITCIAAQCADAIYVCQPDCFKQRQCPKPLQPPEGRPIPPGFAMNSVKLSSVQVGMKTIDVNPTAQDQMLLETLSLPLPVPKWWPQGVPWFPDLTLNQKWADGAACATALRLCNSPLGTYQPVGGMTPFPNAIPCVPGKSPANIPCTSVKPYNCTNE